MQLVPYLTECRETSISGKWGQDVEIFGDPFQSPLKHEGSQKKVEVGFAHRESGRRCSVGTDTHGFNAAQAVMFRCF